MATSSKPCTRCKEPGATLTLRNAPTCPSCYIAYIDQKIARRLTLASKSTRPSPTSPVRNIAGLSLGPCSSLLVHSLSRAATRHRENRAIIGNFETLIVHVDTSLSEAGGRAAEEVVERFRAQCGEGLRFECVPLERVLECRTVDWGALPVGGRDEGARERLRSLFGNLPSVSSRADVLRLLIRHLLLHIAMEGEYQTLLLGNSTTSLAALTLAEVANGRGFSVPWHVDDGDYPVTTYDPLTPGSALANTTFPIYYPIRELFTGEAFTYISLVPTLAALLPSSDEGAADGAVVSHKDLSISEVMTRYFSSVEGPYAGIVTNVVRTTGKLERAKAEGEARACGLCGIALDERGDETWAGELGEDTAEAGTHRLCYGCKRSIHG